LLEGLYGDPAATGAAYEQDGVRQSRVGVLLFQLGEAFADGAGDVYVRFDLGDAVGEAVEVAGVVLAARSEFAAYGPSGLVVELAC
jgi:hypothetical protein